MKMGCDHAAPKRQVNLNADLIERRKSEVGSLFTSRHGCRQARGSAPPHWTSF
jgi:hypothetical protein